MLKMSLKFFVTEERWEQDNLVNFQFRDLFFLLFHLVSNSFSTLILMTWLGIMLKKVTCIIPLGGLQFVDGQKDVYNFVR